MSAMILRRIPLTDEQRAARTPPLWRVWQVARASLVALFLVVFGYGLTALLLVHNGNQDDERAAREALGRQRELCETIVVTGPAALARAFHQPEDSPELRAYRADLASSLSFCEKFHLVTPGP